MQHKPTVSIIVPIYNVEPYLEQCLDSIAGQTLRDIEIICVNDGSTDASPEIISKYAAVDERFVVVDKPNGGYGQAVNWGLERATGKWVGIVEPDDFIAAQMLEDLVNNAYLADGGVPDIVKSSYWLYYDEADGDVPYIEAPALSTHMRGYRYEFNVYEDAQVMRHHPSIWSAIYRRDFIEAHGIRMMEIPGGGWADNPWLYETMLRAESVVWIPCMYYYYRQTNPNSSIAQKNYKMVFDRLRDIRSIYKRFEIENEGLLIALYHRTLNYVHGTVLGSYEMEESDPELQKLIREAFEFMDSSLVARKDNGIGAIKRDYFLDFMGYKTAEVKTHEVEEHPVLSFVLPLKNDRRGLWDTLSSIMRQKETRWEAIVVDCGSRDRGPAIVRDIAERDKRVKLLDEEASNVGEAFALGARRARGDYVSFMRSGVRLISSKCLSGIDCKSLKDGEVDIIAVAPSFDRLVECWGGEDGNMARIDCADKPELVACNLNPSIYAKLFARDMLLASLSCTEGIVCDEDGCALNVAAFLGATRIALVRECEIRDATRVRLMMDGLRDESDLVELEHARYAAMAAVAERIGTDAAWRVARGCIVHAMRIALERRGAKRSGVALHGMLRDVFSGEFGIVGVCGSAYANYEDFRVLEAALCVPYEQYAQLDDASRYKHVVELINKRDSYRRAMDRYYASSKALRKELEDAKGTAGYKVGARVTKLLGGGR